MLAQTHNPTPVNFNVEKVVSGKTFNPTSVLLKDEFPTMLVKEDLTFNPTHQFQLSDITHNPTPTSISIGELDHANINEKYTGDLFTTDSGPDTDTTSSPTGVGGSTFAPTGELESTSSPTSEAATSVPSGDSESTPSPSIEATTSEPTEPGSTPSPTTEAPTVEPSYSPTAFPTTAAPTAEPTFSPTYSYLISISQVVSGVSFDEYSNNTDTFVQVFGDSVVDALDNAISYSDVGIVGVTSASTSSKYQASIYGSTTGLGVDYTINTFSVTGYDSTIDAEAALSSKLQSSVSSGNFSAYLQANAAAVGVSYFSEASSSSITIYSQPTLKPSYAPGSPTPKPTIGEVGEISGITVGVIALIAFIMIIVIPVGAGYCMSSPKVKHVSTLPDETSSLLGRKKEPASMFGAFTATPTQGNAHPDFNMAPSSVLPGAVAPEPSSVTSPLVSPPAHPAAPPAAPANTQAPARPAAPPAQGPPAHGPPPAAEASPSGQPAAGGPRGPEKV